MLDLKKFSLLTMELCLRANNRKLFIEYFSTWISRPIYCYFILLLISSLVNSNHRLEDIHSPCMGCRLFNLQHKNDASKQDTTFCHYPCQCPVEELKCHTGVEFVKDGCGCCYMCARQLGDMCSVKDKCDVTKSLFCDNKDDNSTGTCKGKNKRQCNVNGVTYEHGEKFQPECSRLCTCQNGFYGCVSTCPGELKKPSEETCHEPKLIQVKNQCCKEWKCQKMEAKSSLLAGIRGLESQSLVLRNPLWYRTSTPTTTSSTTTTEETCHSHSSNWTPCSVSCDVGVSVRLVVDPSTCKSFTESRLCYLRPCGVKLATLGRDKCTPTTRSKRRFHIKYQDCISVKDYNLKFCTTCHNKKCCYPRRTRTSPMEFQCSRGKREVLNYMWVKKCRCDKKCYVKSKKKKRKLRRKSLKLRKTTAWKNEAKNRQKKRLRRMLNRRRFH